MKHAWKLILLGLLATLALSGCGQAGDDGAVFVSYEWYYTPTLTTNDPAFPSVIYNGTYYVGYPGRWHMEYISSGNTSILWKVDYTISVDEGEAGGFLSDGDDGVDLYYELYLSSSGPQPYVYEGYPGSERSLEARLAANPDFAAAYQADVALGASASKAASTAKASLKAGQAGVAQDGEINKTLKSGKYTLTLNAKSYKL